AHSKNRRIDRTQARQPRTVEKTRMTTEQVVERGQLTDKVFITVPSQPAALMDGDFFRRQPFHAASESESTIDTRERAQPIAQQRPLAARGGETRVVVRLAVMHVHAYALALAQTVIKIGGHFASRIVLKQFRVGPLHPAFGEERFRRFPRA